MHRKISQNHQPCECPSKPNPEEVNMETLKPACTLFYSVNPLSGFKIAFLKVSSKVMRGQSRKKKVKRRKNTVPSLKKKSEQVQIGNKNLF